MLHNTFRRLPGDALHTLFPDDPFIRWDLARPHDSDIWVLGDAVAFERVSHARHLRGVSIVGVHDVPGLLDGVIAHLPSHVNGIAVERHHLPLLESRLGARLGNGGNWDWMWTTQAPPLLAGEADLVELDDTRDARNIMSLNEIGNPTAESDPGSGRTKVWLGAWDDDELVGAGAIHLTPGGAPHLAGIVIHPRLRGRGLGVALTAGLTRRAVEFAGVCTLGMYADNQRARSVYAGLGFTVARAWASRRLID